MWHWASACAPSSGSSLHCRYLLSTIVGRGLVIEQLRSHSPAVYRKSFDFVFQFICRVEVVGKPRNLQL
jgi:hypothetical protein